MMNGKIGKLIRNRQQFICLVQMPYVGKNRIALQPNSCKKYSVGNQPRAVIYTDINMNSWLVESISTGDLAVIHTTIKGNPILMGELMPL